MPAIRGDRERPEKILVAMYRLSNGQGGHIKYEDIVVEAFKLFPDEFALRGYPEYPDSSDIHKPLYGPLKRGGLIKAANKTFALTEKGLERARRLVRAAGDKIEEKRDPNRLSRDVEREVERMLESEAAKFYRTGQPDKIIDTDFFAFLNCTVRTKRNDFIGRLNTVEDAVANAAKLKLPNAEAAKELQELWRALKAKFQPIIALKKEEK